MPAAWEMGVLLSTGDNENIPEKNGSDCTTL